MNKIKDNKKTPNIITIETRGPNYEELQKTKECQLCGKVGNVQMYCGGPWTWIHPECGEIAEKAINDYLIHMSRHPWSYMINSMHETIKEKEKEI